jgi:two-component system, NtrC family, sensor kinase
LEIIDPTPVHGRKIAGAGAFHTPPGTAIQNKGNPMTQANQHSGLQPAATTGRFQNAYDQMEIIEKARRALLARKRFSVKNQIYIAYALVFIFALIVAIVLIFNIYKIRGRLDFLEVVQEFTVEIQQARRFEKNFFLYTTNLNDALENIHLARSIFADNAEQFISILGYKQQQSFQHQLEAYAGLLEELKTVERNDPGKLSDPQFMAKIENELRQHGKNIVDSAQGLMESERAELSRTLDRKRNIHIFFLVILLLFLIVNAYLLVSRIFKNLNRFSGYAQRIAAGDFTPITPVRRYRDEFTDLSVAINEMIKEIANREAALIQIHKMRAIGTLTAGVAHELNNPMNNIMLTVHMLMEDYATLSDEERMEMLKDAADETARAKNIVGNLLDFARESTSVIQTLDLEKLLKDTIHLAENQVRMSGIKIELQVTENLPSIHGDGQKLQQVFLNLILNAVDVSIKGGKIQVIALPHEKADHVAIKVIDYGVGIPSHILPSIFDPFFTTKAKGKGTGLGLSVSQGIVAKHGGKILVSSEEGSGSIFTVVLPVTTFPRDIRGI